MEFVPVIQALAKVVKFKPPAPMSIQEDSEFSVFGTSSGSTVIAPIPWASDQVVKAATGTDDRRVVKEASSFGDSTLSSSHYQRTMRLSSKFLRLITRLWSICGPPRIQTGIRPSRLALRSLKPPVRQRNSPSCRKHSASLMGRLWIYLQRTQGFISGAFLAREKECQAWLAGLPPPVLPSYVTDNTLPGAISLANFLTAAMSRLAIRQKLEAGFDRRVRFMSVALSRSIVPTIAKLRLKELPLTKGTLFAGKTSTVESTTKAQLISATQAQLARDQPGAGKASGDEFRIPFKKGQGSGGGQAKKGKKGGGNSSSSSDQSGNQKGAGRGRGKGRRGGAKKKDAYSAYNTPKPPTSKLDAE